MITKAKTDSTHSRRTVFSYLQNKESIQSLFGEVATRTAERPGGYTRIIKLGDVRLGDAAEMCMMELVDFNDLYKKDDAAKKGKTRRSRKGKKAEGTTEETAVAAEPKAKVAKAAPKEAKTDKKEKATKAPKKKKE